MPKNRKRNSLGIIAGRILLALVALVLIIAVLLRGNNIALFHSKGMIAHEQRSLMITTVAILLVAAIPALFLVFFTAWKYRESNAKASRGSSPLTWWNTARRPARKVLPIPGRAGL